MPSKHNAEIHIFPDGDGACVKVTLGSGISIKKFESMQDATTCAVSLNLATTAEKTHLDLVQRQSHNLKDLKMNANTSEAILRRAGFR